MKTLQDLNVGITVNYMTPKGVRTAVVTKIKKSNNGDVNLKVNLEEEDKTDPNGLFDEPRNVHFDDKDKKTWTWHFKEN